MADISKEGRMQLALDAYKRGLYPTKKAAAKAFDVPRSTLTTRLQGTTSRKESRANCRKLTDTEETTLSTWILDMERRGLPPRISTVRYLAQKLHGYLLMLVLEKVRLTSLLSAIQNFALSIPENMIINKLNIKTLYLSKTGSNGFVIQLKSIGSLSKISII